MVIPLPMPDATPPWDCCTGPMFRWLEKRKAMVSGVERKLHVEKKRGRATPTYRHDDIFHGFTNVMSW
jgi:hypothetical protein